MSGDNRILIIGGKKQVLIKAKKLGLEVIYVQKKESFDESHSQYVSRVVLTDFTNLETLIPIVKELYEQFPFKHAISLSEFGLVPASYVNECLGLPGNSVATVNLLKDKWEMRKHLNLVGLSTVAANKGTNKEDIISFGEKHGYPIIVKPVNGEGSYGIHKIEDSCDISYYWDKINKMNVNEFLIEEYLDGNEISIEAFSFNGKHVILAMTEKLGYNNFVEVGHVVPARIEKDMYNQAKDMVISFLDVVGLKEGPSHTEVKLTSKGPKIVESHNRRAGGNINELVYQVYGVDMEVLALAWPFKLVSQIDKSPEAMGGACIMFITPPSGKVTKLNGVREIEEHKNTVMINLKIEVNDIIKELSWAMDRSGFLIAKGKDAADAVFNCGQLMSTLDIETATSTTSSI